MRFIPHKKPLGFARNLMAVAILAALPLTATAQLEEIVVTATKRAESLQDVPISIVALSGQAIKDLAITRGEEFTADIPAVTIAQNPISNFVFIRGIGTSGSNAGIEQSVSIFHDGIYMGRHQLSRAPFMDLERVEVLRGPQGILFGKNTIGGAIHVIAAKPTEEFEGSVSALVGGDGEQEYTGVISGPITENLRGRLSVRDYQYDGFLDNVITGQEGPQRDDQTIRAQLAWDVTDNFSLSAKVESSEYEQTQQSTQLAVIDPTPGSAGFSGLNQALVAAATGGDGIERLDDERAVDNDGGALLGQLVPFLAGVPGFPDSPEFSNNSSDVGSITAEWFVGGHTITSITGFAQYDFQDVCDCDFAALPLIQVDAREDYEQFSQEIRITSPVGQTLEYIAGVYFQDADLEYRSIEGFGTGILAIPNAPAPVALFPNLTRDYTFVQDQETAAVFGQLKWNINDRTRATLGLRYSDESKDVNHRLDVNFTAGQDYSALAGLPAGTLAFGDTPEEFDRFLATPGLEVAAATAQGILQGLLGTFEHDITSDRDEDFVTWSIGLQHDFNDNVMGFATVSTGVKGGGFDARFLRENDSPFFEYEEEEVLNFEIGFKSSLAGGNLQFNGAAFFSTVEDYQVSIFDGATAFFVQNAAEVETQGIEVDLKWLASENFLMSFSAVYLDAEYEDFPNAPCFTISGTEPVERGACIGRGTADAFRDASGETNIFSPEFSFNLNLDYNIPVSSNWEFRAVANINYSDDFLAAADLDPIYAGVDSFTKLDLRFSVSSLDGKWDFALLGKNLTEEFSSGSSNDQPLVAGNGFASTDRLRSVAVQATYRF